MNIKPSLKRNACFNFLGSALPMFVSLVTVPLYLQHIGNARYGVLAIVWMMQGYFGYFDLGLAAATANQIARLSEATPAERESVLWTALILNAGIGAVSGLILFVLARTLFSLLHIDPALNAEVVAVLPWIACSVPLATLSGVFAGALTGREQFAALNAAQLFGIFVFQLVPLGTAILVGPGLQHLIPAAILGSVASLVMMIGVVCVRFPIRFAAGPRRALVKPLFSYGVWVLVTNLTVPLLEVADRLLIGRVLGPQAIAYYQVPFNLAVRVRIIPNVLSRTLFPRLSALDASNAAAMSVNAVRGIAATMTPLVVFGIFLMQPFLTFWINRPFALQAQGVGETILVGVWIFSLTSIPYNHLQACGRPHAVARVHALELVPFIAGLWWALHAFGLVGAAAAWSARCTVECTLLFAAARLGREVLVHIAVSGSLVALAFVARLLFPWPTWSGAIAWAVLTGIAMACTVRTTPALRAMLRRVTSSRLQRA